MAIYHFSAEYISAGKGKSVVKSSAYLSGSKLHREKTDENCNYSRKEEVRYSEVLTPPGTPEKFKDREILWNTVEFNAIRYDARLGRIFDIALPDEWTIEEMIERSRQFIQKAFVDRGLIADWALHLKDGNPHIHVLTTLSALDKDGKPMFKSKEVFANDFDEYGNAIYNPSLPSYDPANKEETAKYKIPKYERNKDGTLKLDEKGNPVQKTRVRPGKGTEYVWEKVNLKSNPFNKKEMLITWRKEWADFANQYLPADKHIDHRSYKEQGIDEIPTIHEGMAARGIFNRTGHSDRCDWNLKIKQMNEEKDKAKIKHKEEQEIEL